MADEVRQAEEDVQVVREIIAFMRSHADELRQKGVPVDDMIRDLEEKIAELLAAARRIEVLHAEDELLTRKREQLRRSIDETAGHLPPDLTDGMSTIDYLHAVAEKEVERRRRGRRGVGG